MSTRPYVRVALPVPLGQAFTYRLGADQSVQPGSRVVVEFGRRKTLAVVIDQVAELPEGVPEDKIKPLLSVLDQEPVLPPELLAFLLELARYYVAPIGEVLRLALPALERALAEDAAKSLGKKVQAVGHLVQTASAVPRASWPDASVTLPRGHAAALLQTLEEGGPQELAKLTETYSTARAIVQKLEALGVVQVDRIAKKTDPFFSAPLERDTPPTLTAGQTAAVERIGQAIARGHGGGFLLDGVTASGKTEVYLHAAKEALSRGQGVIILVPEIALTPQLVRRFRARLGDAIAVLHSGLTDGDKLTMWRSLRSGELRVVVGARSSLFAPIIGLGLICVDEEHDSSFKQEEGVRYNARDMALLRGHRASSVVVLGSATPSLASEALVNGHKIERLRLPERARKSAALPEVEIIDLKRFGPGPSGDSLLSLPLHRAIEDNLAEKGQTILFLNRRGFAPSLICGSCGEISQCPHCSVALTLHRHGSQQAATTGRLECHYCDYSLNRPDKCQKCDGTRFIEEGTGTERIEALLAESFPNARVARLDRDVARGTKSEKILERMHAGEIDILVGTQMVTKGHDLPEVTLVGVLNADAALSLPDFRAAERTFHLLVQVAGRAGRADRAGRVLIQTRNPDHPAILAAKTHDVRSFIRGEMAQREDVGYPPFSRMALVRVDGANEVVTSTEAARLSELARSVSPDVLVLGPAAAPLRRLRSRFRFQLMLRADDRNELRKALLLIARSPLVRGVRASIDVDPLSML